MFIDGVLIEPNDLVNGVLIVQAEKVAQVDYFHIELETHDVIIAEGALSTTAAPECFATCVSSTRSIRMRCPLEFADIENKEASSEGLNLRESDTAVTKSSAGPIH